MMKPATSLVVAYAAPAAEMLRMEKK